MFDKAKENLMKIKNDIDQMNQYDYKHMKHNSSAAKHYLAGEEISKRDIEHDEYE